MSKPGFQDPENWRRLPSGDWRNDAHGITATYNRTADTGLPCDACGGDTGRGSHWFVSSDDGQNTCACCAAHIEGAMHAWYSWDEEGES